MNTANCLWVEVINTGLGRGKSGRFIKTRTIYRATETKAHDIFINVKLRNARKDNHCRPIPNSQPRKSTDEPGAATATFKPVLLIPPKRLSSRLRATLMSQAPFEHTGA